MLNFTYQLCFPSIRVDSLCTEHYRHCTLNCVTAWDFCELPLSLDMMSMGASSPAPAVIPWDLVYLAGSESCYAPRPFALHLICYLALATRETESWMNGNDSIERPGPLSIYRQFIYHLSHLKRLIASPAIQSTPPRVLRTHSSLAIKIESPSSLPSSTM